jgi:hypothetical protein
MSKHLFMKAPPWFQPALNEIQNTIEAAKTELQTSIDNLKTELQEKVNRIEVKLNSIERTGAIVRGPLFIFSISFPDMLVMKSYNMSAADGQNINFKRVPFPDGSDPVTEVR